MQDANWEQIRDQLSAQGLRVVSPRWELHRLAPGFEHEADWSCYGTGYGVADRWLITSVGAGGLGSGSDRWLLAYEMDADNARTGRVVLVGGPISEEDDHRLLQEANNSRLITRQSE